jgi:hypothetical protein
VACDDNGLAVFELLRRKPEGRHVFLFAFDLLELDGKDLRREPLEVRKATLASLLRGCPPGARLCEHLEHEDGAIVFRHAYVMGLEGIVSKHWVRFIAAAGRGTGSNSRTPTLRLRDERPRKTGTGERGQPMPVRERSGELRFANTREFYTALGYFFAAWSRTELAIDCAIWKARGGQEMAGEAHARVAHMRFADKCKEFRSLLGTGKFVNGDRVRELLRRIEQDSLRERLRAFDLGVGRAQGGVHPSKGRSVEQRVSSDSARRHS